MDLNRLPKARQLLRLAARDQHLAGPDLVQHEILPRPVQLGQYVVQEQYRFFAGVPPKQFPLRELQTDGRRPRLAL